MAPDVHRLLIGHMGCYAALPGLGVAADFARARGRPAVLLCLELPSLHVQPAAPGRADLTQVVAHALFGDAAAAAVVTPDGPGFEVADLTAVTDTSASAYMTWDVTDHGFRMALSPRVPGVLARHVHGVVTGLLGRHGLEPAASPAGRCTLAGLASWMWSRTSSACRAARSTPPARCSATTATAPRPPRCYCSSGCGRCCHQTRTW